MRSDGWINNVIPDAKDIAKKIGIVPEFEKETTVRQRKEKKIFWGGKWNCKYWRTLTWDQFLLCITRHCNTLRQGEIWTYWKPLWKFKFIYDIQSFRRNFADKEEFKEACKYLQIILSEGEDYDVNDYDLFEELQIFAEMLSSKSPPAQALSYIAKYCYMSTFPNVFIALRILWTLPASIASDESSFSELKLRVINHLVIYWRIPF